MKVRTFFLSLLVALAVLTLGLPAAAAPEPATASCLITKKSNLILGSGSISLPKGTKFEVLSTQGENLVVKYHGVQGLILAADTDFDPATIHVSESALDAVAKPGAPANVAAAPVAKSPAVATPPALSTNPAGPQPTSNYGKMVQKAKINEQAHKDSLVDPTNETTK